MKVFDLIEKVGLPIAGGLIMGYFIFLIMKQLMGNLVSDIKGIQGITKMLITRASIMNNDIIRIDTSVSRPCCIRNEKNYYTPDRPTSSFRPRYDTLTTESKYCFRTKRTRGA